MSEREALYCSFCGASNSEVLCLIAAPPVFICDECVDLCMTIVADRRRDMSPVVARTLGWTWPIPGDPAFAPGEP